MRPYAPTGVCTRAIPWTLATCARPSVCNVGSFSGTRREMLPSVSLPRSPYASASGNSPTPTLSRIVRKTRSIIEVNRFEVRQKFAQRGVAFAGDVNPVQVRLFAEPDQLPARVLAVLEDDQLACGGFIADAVQMLQRLPVDEAGERQRGLGNAARQQRAHFIEQALRELLVHAAGDAFERLLGRDLQRERGDLVFRQRRFR